MIDATIIRAHPCAAGYEKDQGAWEDEARLRLPLKSMLALMF
jgi:hypothetical protein